MKKTLLIAGALLALTATAASAGGVNLSWNDCGLTGVALRTNACTSNTGAPGQLIVSCIPSAPMPQLNGSTITIDLQTTAPTLSDYWQLGAGGCRAAALSGSFSFTLGPYTCLDIWAGGASGGINYNPGFGGPNRARLKATCAISGNTPASDVDEIYLVNFIFTNTKTVGTGACAGCTDGACIVLNDVLLTQPLGVGDYHLNNALDRQYVAFQTSGQTGCPDATPTKNATWGSVKSLYR